MFRAGDVETGLSFLLVIRAKWRCSRLPDNALPSSVILKPGVLVRVRGGNRNRDFSLGSLAVVLTHNFYLNLRHPNTYTFLPNGIKNKKIHTCFYSERWAFADRFPSLTSSHGTLQPLWDTSHVADHMPPSCSCCRTSVELARSQSARGIADCPCLLTARSLGWKSGGGGMGPCSQPASWDRHLTVKREWTMVLSIVVLSMRLPGGGGGRGGTDAGSLNQREKGQESGN